MALEVRLNVYDLIVDESPLTRINNKTKPFGFGAFHSGILVGNKEYSYASDTGAHPRTVSLPSCALLDESKFLTVQQLLLISICAPRNSC